MTPRRPRPSEVAVLLSAAALALAPAACGGSDNEPADGNDPAAERPAAEQVALESAPGGDADAGDAPAEGSGEASQTEPVPSDFARRTIPKPLLRLYLKAGEDLLIDWWVIAAVDQIDLKAGDPGIPPRERIPGIGYSLAAAGAPYDNHAALAARAGGAYAERALGLAGRYVDTAAEQREADEGEDDEGGSEEP